MQFQKRFILSIVWLLFTVFALVSYSDGCSAVERCLVNDGSAGFWIKLDKFESFSPEIAKNAKVLKSYDPMHLTNGTSFYMLDVGNEENENDYATITILQGAEVGFITSVSIMHHSFTSSKVWNAAIMGAFSAIGVNPNSVTKAINLTQQGFDHVYKVYNPGMNEYIYMKLDQAASNTYDKYSFVIYANP